MLPRDVLHQRRQLFAVKQRAARAHRDLAGEIIVVQQHQRAFKPALILEIRELLGAIGRRVVRPRRVSRFPAPVGDFIVLGDVPPQIIRNLARAGGIQVLVRVEAIRRVIRHLIHAHKVDEIHAVGLGDAADRVRIHLLFLVGRIGQMHQQHLNSPRLTILNDPPQIDEAGLPALLRRLRLVNQIVILRVRHGDDALRALFPVVCGMEIRVRQLAPARVIFAQREQIFPFHVRVGRAAVIHRVRVVHQIVHRPYFRLRDGVAVKRRVHVAAVAGNLVALAHALHIQHNQLRRGVIQRVLQRPIGDRQRVAVAGDVVARNAVFFPDFHRKNARVHNAVAEEKHVVFPRTAQKRLHLLPALLALDQPAYARNGDRQQRAEREYLEEAPDFLFHVLSQEFFSFHTHCG